MAFDDLVSGLRETEQQLTKQLEGVRAAIVALASGRSRVPAIRRRRGRPARAVVAKPVRKSGSWSAAARKAVSLRMKKYWAARRKAQAA